MLALLGTELTDRTLILPQGSYKTIAYDPVAGAKVRSEFGLDQE